ncbi:MAG: hypothetical protein SA339_08350 [Methanomassiliicoccus sp.]|nr:hypothetical protein [Methanomassiliicoccus sp.]
MRKSIAIALVALLMASSLLIIGPGTQQASASSTTIVYSTSQDGAIGTNYTTDVPFEFYTTGTRMNLGPFTADFYGRGYFFFDLTSIVPSGAVVDSATLNLHFASVSGTKSMAVYSGNLGSTLDLSDWGQGVTNGTYLGTAVMSGTSGWTSIDISSSSITSSMLGIEMAMVNEKTFWNSAGIHTSEAEVTYRSYLSITYHFVGSLTYQLSGGGQYGSSIPPIVSAYNSTHDTYLFEFDTWTGVNNVTIAKGSSSWALLASTPQATSVTDNATVIKLTGVVSPATYRVYVSVPRTSMSTIHVGTYVSSTGEGLAFETFHMRYCLGLTYNASAAQEIVDANFLVPYGPSYTIAVLDYFGNVIATQSFVASADVKYISIPLDIYSFKSYNQQDDFARFRIYYNNTGDPLSFYLAPQETVERFLRPGAYTVVVTNYPAAVAATSQYFNLTISDAEFLMLNGTTISRVISDVAGVMALQQVITAAVTPDMVFIRENMPSVPTEAVEYIHPWSVLTATREQDGTGTSIALGLPYPNVAGTTYTIISDKVYISGQYATSIWVNDTAGTSIYTAANLPSSITLAGQNVTIESSAPITAQRVTEFRSETLFYWQFFTTQKKYDVTLSINDTMAQDLKDLNWFVGWPENRSVDLSSVKVYDVDNDVTLVAGLNYDVTTAGIRFHFDSLLAGASRTFQITCYDSNTTSGQSVPMIYVDIADDTTFEGTEYQHCHASWTSNYSATYEGLLNIKLDITGSQYIKSASVVVVDATNNRQLDPTEYYVSGNIVTINHAMVATGAVQAYDVYFKMDYAQGSGWSITEPLMILPGGFPITGQFIGLAAILVVAAFTVMDYLKYGSISKIWGGLLITTVSIVMIVFMLYGGVIA